MSDKTLDSTEKMLLELLRRSLESGVVVNSDIVGSKDADIDRMIDVAKSHAVISFITEEIAGNRDGLTQIQRDRCAGACESVVLGSHRMLYMTDRCLKRLDEAGINGVVLKGWSVAGYFRVPELRKVGDVDILVAEGDVERAAEVLKDLGLEAKEVQDSLHHIELENKEGLTVEIHNMLVEPFDDEEINRRIRKIGSRMLNNTEIFEYNGYVIRGGAPEYNAISLILHMLQHYMRAGFGLKLLCDWVVFINNGVDDRQYAEFERLAKALGIQGFVKMINSVCCRYLGMKAPAGADISKNGRILEAFMKDLLEGEEFGRSGTDRMVVLNGKGIPAYLKELHHQMKLNNASAARWRILWPYLWVKTGVVFVINNRKVRGTSTLSILKNAGKRGKLVEEMKLFKVAKK